MPIIGAAFFPHPPIVLPEVGRGQEKDAQATIDGMTELARLVAEMRPDVIAVMTPHGPAFSDVIAMTKSDEISGNLEQFGAPQVSIAKKVNGELMTLFEREVAEGDLPVAFLDSPALSRLRLKPTLDHGALVPLYFIEKQYRDYTILHMAPGGLSLRKQFAAGQALRRAAEKSGLRVLVLSSGDMSHRLKATGPYGFDAAGPVFDGLIADAVKRGDPGAILSIDPALARKAGECGWKPAAFSLGTLDGDEVECKLLSYEGPFSVGYMTALMTPKGTGAASLAGRLDEAEQGRSATLRQGEDAYVRLARQSVEKFVRTGSIPRWQEAKAAVGEADASGMEQRRAGAFVSLHLEGELRGCMGTISPVRAHVGEEIVRNAVMACSEDPRFPAVEEEELMNLSVKVDVLSPSEPIASPTGLDPKRYGVIVEKGGRRGLLLPRLEGVDTVRQQLDIACRKAGFKWDEEDDTIKLYRFTVERHGEED